MQQPSRPSTANRLRGSYICPQDLPLLQVDHDPPVEFGGDNGGLQYGAMSQAKHPPR